jgi:Type IX secretion system protein PorV
MFRKIIFAIAVAGIFIPEIGSAQDAISTITTAVPFMLIVPDSRAGGMGETGVALADNAWATFWNPAGLSFQKGSELAMTHTNWLPALGLSDLWIAHLAYKQPVEELDGFVGAQLTYLNLGVFNRTSTSPDVIGTFNAYEMSVAATYSTKLNEQLGIGTSVRIIYSHLADQGAGQEQGSGTSTGFCFDLGLMYRPLVLLIPLTGIDLGKSISFGMNIANVGPKMSYVDKAQADPLPMNLRLGIAYKIIQSEYNNMSATAEVSRLLVYRNGTSSDEFYKAFFTTWTGSSLSEQIRRFDSAFGLEYWYGSPKLIGLRVGYFYEDPREGNRKFMTFGAGLRYDIYAFDFGYLSALEGQSPLDGTLRLSLSIGWGGDVN